MGCCYSSMVVEKEEAVSRCKSRRRYMKHLVRSRHAFSSAHFAYLRSLRSTGSALLNFATAESNNHQYQYQHQYKVPFLATAPAQPPPAATPPPPMSPVSSTWTSVSQSPSLHPPPPPASSWDFWDPFMPSSSRSPAATASVAADEDWDVATSVSDGGATTTAGSTATMTPLPPPPPPPALSVTTASASVYSKETSDLAVVVSRKDLVEMMKELDDYFLKAADGGGHVSALVGVPDGGLLVHAPPPPPPPPFATPTSKVYNSGWSLNSPRSWRSWGTNSKWRGFSDYGSYSEEIIGNGVHESHCSTVERLYAWERKLYEEVKSGEVLKKAHDQKGGLQRKLEVKGSNYLKMEKNRKDMEKLASRMMVASQAMHTTSAEIVRLRENQLFPQLLELVKGLMYMWRSMYQCHQVQMHIVQQLKFLDIVVGNEPTSPFQRQATLQLEHDVQQWHLSFCNLIKTQRDYMQALTGWLRLSLFQTHSNSFIKLHQNPPIYSICEEWILALDRLPDKVASEGIKSFHAVVHTVAMQQAEELKQKKRSEAACRDLDKKMTSLHALELKHGPYPLSASTHKLNPVAEKRAKVDALRSKAEEEKNKYLKCVSVSRAMTVNNLQMGFPNVFQAMTGFASICMQAFESVYNQTKNIGQVDGIKMLT